MFLSLPVDPPQINPQINQPLALGPLGAAARRSLLVAAAIVSAA